MRAGCWTGTGAAGRPMFMEFVRVICLLTSSKRASGVRARYISRKPPRQGDNRTTGFEPASPSDRWELSGLEVVADGLVDVVLAGLRVRAPQLPRAQPAQLEDLEHVDEVDARREPEREQPAHHQRPAEDQVAVAVRVRDEAQRDRDAGHRQRPRVEIEHGTAL